MTSLTAADTSKIPVQYIECSWCHEPCYKAIYQRKYRFCTVNCFTLHNKAELFPIEKMCCICHSFFFNNNHLTVSKGDICTAKCFHLWLDHGIAKYRAHVHEKQLYLQKIKSANEPPK